MFENTLFATGLSPEHVCFIRAQWLPVDTSVAWQNFRAQLDGHIRWRQISPRDAVFGTSVLLLSCFCLLENRIYSSVDEGSLLKAPPQATRNI